jgi:ABC-type amino acid transport substrate-binding protein
MRSFQSARPRRHRAARPAACVLALLVTTPLALAQQPPGAPAAAGTLDRLRASGEIRVGYRTDARPFSFTDDQGQAAGYSVDLCRRIVTDARVETARGQLKVTWIPVTADDRFRAVQEGRVDLLCGAETVTLARRADVSFSIPIFPGGIGTLVRSDVPARLREVLSGRPVTYRPTWRAAATQVLQARAFCAVAGTTGERWLNERVADLHIIADVITTGSYEAGIEAVIGRSADALFGERAVLLDLARRHPASRDLMVLDRLFTYEPLALAFARGDEHFRLVVDRALSRLYASGEVGALFTKWFGEPDQTTLAFFRWNTLTD